MINQDRVHLTQRVAQIFEDFQLQGALLAIVYDESKADVCMVPTISPIATKMYQTVTDSLKGMGKIRAKGHVGTNGTIDLREVDAADSKPGTDKKENSESTGFESEAEKFSKDFEQLLNKYKITSGFIVMEREKNYIQFCQAGLPDASEM